MFDKTSGLYETEKLLTGSNCDMFYRWSIWDIFISMQESAGYSAEYMGVGRDELMGNGMIWIISRMHVKMLKYPKYLDKIKVKTWPKQAKGIFFPRYFEFTDSGETLGHASSSWLLLNLEHRRLLRPQNLTLEFMTNEDLPEPLPLPEKIIIPESLEHTTERTVQYSDCDFNMHMNNSKYAQFACDLLPFDYLESNAPKEFIISYNAEASIGNNITMQHGILDNHLYVSGSCENKNIFEAKIVL